MIKGRTFEQYLSGKHPSLSKNMGTLKKHRGNVASLRKPTSRVDLCTLTKASNATSTSAQLMNCHHLTIELFLIRQQRSLLNCYPEQIYIEITNDTQQTNEGITTEGPGSLESQLPPRELLLASAHLSAPTVEGRDREPGKQGEIIGCIPPSLLSPFCTHLAAF